MASLKNSKTGKTIELKEGDSIQHACEIVGVDFNCKNGVCSTCMVDVVKGQENLSKMTDQEKLIPMDKNQRLACQCRIEKGEVEIIP